MSVWLRRLGYKIGLGVGVGLGLGGVLLVLFLILFPVMNQLFPLPKTEEGEQAAVLVVSQEGVPLRAFANQQGVWFYSLQPRQVSPLYLQALLGYEDRWFYQHPGINPFSILRAMWQNLQHGRAISGGSTLTMQVARLLDPHQRTIAGKLKQMFRALQLEWHYSKEEILALYLNHAPYGGTLQGVQAASFAYLAKSPDNLSHAEAALLAVLPQAPSRLRPDRHPKRAQQARDKVLDRMATWNIWTATQVAEAKQEQVASLYWQHPMTAPLLARRLRKQAKRARVNRQKRVITTTVEAGLQWNLENRLADRLGQWPAGTSAAVLVLENRELQVRAYAGSADFADQSRFGHVDMVQAWRSPGSTLKPFLYGFALEEGIVHSESLLVDALQSFKGYQPNNFHGGFHGPVSFSEALQKSLNIPAVDLLDRLGPARFVARLRQGGLRLRWPAGGGPNLAVILGGVGATLESLTVAYAALARQGLGGTMRFSNEEPVQERRMLSAGAAWIIRQTLANVPRPYGPLPLGPMDDPEHSFRRRIAWKTGTSYGFRDAWAIGVSDRLTIGVWVGRPDGTPLPGHYGTVTAAPLLFEIFDGLARQRLWEHEKPPPDSVVMQEICWPLGTTVTANQPETCHLKRKAWTLNGMVPPTFTERSPKQWQENPLTFWINPQTSLWVDASCSVPQRIKKTIALWPLALQPWLMTDIRTKSQRPKRDPSCPDSLVPQHSRLQLTGITSGTVLRRAGTVLRRAGTATASKNQEPIISLSALGGQGKLYWLVNGRMHHTSGLKGTFRYRFNQPGPYEITVMDQSGLYDRVVVQLLP